MSNITKQSDRDFHLFPLYACSIMQYYTFQQLLDCKPCCGGGGDKGGGMFEC